jgi:predicted transcriptional regulator
MERPGFLRNNEEWIVWLLAGEPEGSMTPEELAEKTSLPPDQLHDNLLYLERVRILSLERDPARRYPLELSRAIITREGRTMSEELRSRPDMGDDLF